MNDFYINGYSAGEHGIYMGEKFISNLNAPYEMKDYVTNESRLEDGKRYIIQNTHKKSRSLTLSFVITGNSRQECEANYRWLLDNLYNGSNHRQYPQFKGRVLVRVPHYPMKALVFTGKSISYNLSFGGKEMTLTAGFDDPVV